MKVCAYVMTYDTGLAPNPFHGLCTLAVCSPNHLNANLGNGDYIVGVAGAEIRSRLNTPNEWRLIYAMQIDKRITLDEYYRSSVYKSKIPKRSGPREVMCGDNFYKLSGEELVHTGESTDHDWREAIEKDCKGNRVFIGKGFLYFGKDAEPFPETDWATKLKNQLTYKPRGVSYIFGGRGRHLWTIDDLKSFKLFFSCHASPIPKNNPVDFDNWKSESGEESCSKCT
ncbi:MAG: hypothetical protein KKA63_10765 [Gammaproteobacteria bacterium]|nr:hypothetical protein [Gammaproteobacteria bacterium]